MIADIITQSKDEIAALCRKYRVRRLYLFGSATTDAWDPETSDVDFLVDLGEYDDRVHMRYLEFADALEGLLGRNVDLVTVRSLKNPYFIEELEETRVQIYESSGSEEAA